MNSLSDILSKKADDLFPDDPVLSNSIAGQNSSASSPEPATGPIAAVEKKEEAAINIQELKNSIYRMKDELDAMLRLLSGEHLSHSSHTTHHSHSDTCTNGGHIIEGVFNGHKMVGSDGKEYAVPPNYTSKSKLVEGDRMKLTITNRGSFIYKQIVPIERKRLIGELVFDPTSHQWSVLCEGKTYKILTASATFYKGKPGDQVIFLVPITGPCSWGAVENIIPR